MLKPARPSIPPRPRAALAALSLLSVLALACASSGEDSAGGSGASGDAASNEGQARTPGEVGETAAVRVTLFENGEVRATGLSASAAGEVADFLCASIERADMVLRVAMNTESIEEIKATERGIEVELPEARELTAGNTGQVLAPTRLLVPLTGTHAATPPADNLTILHGAPDYSPGPLLIKSGRDSLLRLLSSHGVE